MKKTEHQSTDTLYLEKLEFRPELRRTWLNFFVTNFRVVILLIALITAWGIYAYNALPRESNPEVKIPTAIVTTSYLGVSPTDMEELVTKKLETGIVGISGVNKITSSSLNSLSMITVEFDAKEDLDDSIRRLRDEVTTRQKDLPADADDSRVSEISIDDTPIWTLALTGPYDGFTLRALAEEIQAELEKIPGVREVQISGGDEREWEIAYDPTKIVTYGITPEEANQIIRATNFAFPAGNFEGEKFNYSIRADSRFFTTEKLAELPLTHTDDGGVVYLRDLATVRERAIKKTVYSRLFSKSSCELNPKVEVDKKADAKFPISNFQFPNKSQILNFKTSNAELGTSANSESIVNSQLTTHNSELATRCAPTPAITLAIVKKTGGSVLDVVDTAKATIERMIAPYRGVTYDVTLDFAKQIRDDFDQLKHDFFLTTILVFSILFLVVGLKEALVAGLAVPLVFAVTFGVMLLTGISLNFLSNLSLLLALGLLVDDAIVVVSATKQYLRTGKYTPEEAVLLVLNDFKVVLTTTTLTTVWAFLPLLMSTGIIGEFIKSIPITVSVTLIASLFIALMINHPLAAVLERIRMTCRFFWIVLSVLVLSAGMSLWNGIGSLIASTTSINGGMNSPINVSTSGTTIFADILFVLVGFGILFGIFYLMRWYFHGGRERLLANAELTEREWNDDDLIKQKLREQGSHEDTKLSSRLLHGILKLDPVLPFYDKYLRRIIATKSSRRKTFGVVVATFLLAVSFPIIGIVPAEFFPLSDSTMIFVNVEGPTGMKLAETNQILEEIEARLPAYREIESFSTLVGRASDFSKMGSGPSNASHLGSIILKLTPEDARDIPAYELADEIRLGLHDIAGAKITVDAPRGGPPSGAAFQAQIAGEDLQALDRIAHELEPFLRTIPGVTDTSTSLKSAPAEYTFTLDPVRLELYDLNSVMVGGYLRLAIAGTKVSTVILDGEEVELNARFAEEKIPTLASLQNLQILNKKKQPVFLRDVARIELTPALESITRIDQKRTVLLSAGINGETNSNAVVAEFQKRVAANYKLPDGYAITYGGENEQNAESVASILRAMLIAGLLIISTLIIQFNSFKKALIVLVTIPLALIGVFFGMALFQVTLSFPGLIGILALFGIVVKNAIILIDKINLNIRMQIPFREAIIDAGKSRLEAILITSLSTIFGILPVTLSNATWLAMGSAIIFGLSLSSFLTLFIIPTLFVSWIGEKERF